MPIPSLARCLRFALLSLCAVPAAAQTPKPVTPVRGMRPKAALEALDVDGFKTRKLRLDGVDIAEADLVGKDAVVSWTVPPEWKSADPAGTLEVGFETYVRVADHIGQDASDAAAEARSIGYALNEGNPADGKGISSADDRVVESYYSSSADAGDIVAVGAHVGVILVSPSSPLPGSPSTLVLGAAIAGLIGVAAAATILRTKSAKG